MKDNTKYVGLDVAKDSIAVAIAEEGRAASTYYGKIENTVEAVDKLIKRLGQTAVMKVCYEAGPTGYWLHRHLTHKGVSCEVVAPSLIPRRQGDRVKTDRRDAQNLAQLLRAGELSTVHVPTEENEALRDLVRVRQDVKADQQGTRVRIRMFLLRHDIHSPQKMTPWTKKHRVWLGTLKFKHDGTRIAFQEYLHQLDEIGERLARLEEAIHHEVMEGVYAFVIRAIQCLRGVSEITAATLVAEIGQFSRFKNPRQLMAYAGIVPREYSSGPNRWQGGITKTGNSRVRHVIIEAAWSYRYSPAVKGKLRKRQEGQLPEAQRISWKAQHRLNTKYRRMMSRGKSHGVTVTAIARELLGFVWAIACEAERQQTAQGSQPSIA